MLRDSQSKSSHSSRPRWAEDKLAYARLLRLQGYRGKLLKLQLFKMEMKELKALSLLPDFPVEPRLLEHNSPDIDLLWVAGETCTGRFSCLTFYERWILFLLFHDPDTVHVELGVSRKTYRKKLQNIKKKMQGDLDES